MKYLLLIYSDEQAWQALGERERADVMREHDRLTAELEARGEFLASHALEPPPASSVVLVRDGQPAVSDGPYAETKEHMAGYYLVDVADRVRAHDVAARIPGGPFLVGVEVRPVRDDQ